MTERMVTELTKLIPLDPILDFGPMIEKTWKPILEPIPFRCKVWSVLLATLAVSRH